MILDGLLAHCKLQWLNIAHNRKVSYYGFRFLIDFLGKVFYFILFNLIINFNIFIFLYLFFLVVTEFDFIIKKKKKKQNQKNLQLKYLDFSGINIDTQTAELISVGLRHKNCFVSVLRMQECGIKYNELQALGKDN